MVYLVVKEDKLVDDKLLQRLMTAVNILEYEIINIKFFRLKDRDTFHICFGEAAYQSTKQFVKSLDRLIQVSDINKLIDLPGNQKFREETYNLLKNLNQHIDIISKKVTPNVLTSLNSNNLNSLKDELINNNIKGFTTLDSTGKKIRISVDDTDDIKEEINISIQELITLKLISEVFNITNPIIISNKEKST